MNNDPAEPRTTDLVATLRDPNWTHPPRHLLLSAADEIERLRGLLRQIAKKPIAPIPQQVEEMIRG